MLSLLLSLGVVAAIALVVLVLVETKNRKGH